jgi:type II secretory pathway component PulF
VAQFTYTARAVSGELKSATIEAPNRDEVIKQLQRQRLNVVKIDEGSAQKKRVWAGSRCATSSSSRASFRR